MSPSEDQLRAALRSGQGEAPDPDAIIGQALHVRHQRRQRLVGVAATVVVVGGLGAGLAAWSAAGGGNGQQSASGGNAGAAAGGSAGILGTPPLLLENGTAQSSAGSAYGANVSGGVGGDVDTAPDASTPADCPSTAVRYALAGGGGTDQFGASRSLFDGSVTSILVCWYSPTVSGALMSKQVLTGSAATRAATTLDAAPSKQGVETACLTAVSIELIPTGTNGKAMTPISVTGQCSDAIVTNGTAVRFVPLAVLGVVPPAAASSSVPPGDGPMSGSPAR